MAPLPALAPPALPRPQRRDEDDRAVGNDGLTDLEREEHAWHYVTTGAGRPMSESASADLRVWLAGRRGRLLG